MTEGSNRGAIVSVNIGVVVVTYRPEEAFETRLRSMRAQGGALVVVDNASPPAERERLERVCAVEGWSLIANPENLGLAAALNQGVRSLTAQGFQWLLLFDQDSEPAPDMSEQLLATLGRQPRGEKVAVVGANFADPKTNRPHRFLRPHPRWSWLFEKTPLAGSDLPVTMVITSGSLVRAEAFSAAGPFEESFFIDYVDTDFCLRCRRAGWRVVASAAARMTHPLGERTARRWLGVAINPTNHSALRHYYIARNRVPMIARHAVRAPHWFLFDGLAAGLWLLRVLVAEDEKALKFAAMLLGTWDGLRGVGGRCSERRERWLRS